MRSLFALGVLLGSLASHASALAGIPAALTYPLTRRQAGSLGSVLSSEATIKYDVATAQRWSDYKAPTPGIVVNVATERDVAETVKWARKNKKPFLAQSGGHGWTNSLNLGSDGVLINMRGLNSVSVAADKKSAKIGGGTIVSEVINTAYNSDAHILHGGCNCVGMLGAGLGGGLGSLMGLYGPAVDNMLSLNVVLADGSMQTVTSAQAELWFALRGAGPNFGIVTSAVYKAYPMPKAQNNAWLGGLIFTPDKLESVTQEIENLDLKAEMNIFLYLINDPTNGPLILVTVFYFGTEQQGRAAFKSILDIGPIADTTKVLPQTQWNTAADPFCDKGQRKPGSGVSFNHFVPSTWRAVFNEYVKFSQHPGAGRSVILVECYSLKKAQREPTAASWPGRDLRFSSAILPWYSDPSLDSKAFAFGRKVRDLVRETDGYGPLNRTYVNFAGGDEDSSTVYQYSTPLLKALKRKYDPSNVFSHWFSLA